MFKSKLISVITVTYNSASVLPATLESILRNKSDAVEYIIIDGASTDESHQLFEQYKAQIDYFVSEKDKGIYDAMNKGLAAAKGDYVIFINAGDYFFNEDTIANLVNLIQNNQPDVIYGETMLIDNLGKELGSRSENSSRKLPAELTWKSLNKGMVVSHQSFLVKRNLAENYNLAYSSSADVDWVIRCLKSSKKIIKADFFISKYLIGGYSKRTLETSLSERFKIFTRHYGLLPNIWNHILITCRALSYKIKRKPLN